MEYIVQVKEELIKDEVTENNEQKPFPDNVVLLIKNEIEEETKCYLYEFEKQKEEDLYHTPKQQYNCKLCTKI